MTKIIDCFTFNGEYDLLEIRLNILNECVDEFIIVEAPTTFSGLPKPLYYEEQKERFSRWAGKIKYYKISEDYMQDEISLASQSPNTRGAAHWKHEFLQKESIKKALTHLSDNDIVFISDCDEIWNPAYLQSEQLFPITKLGMYVYTYYLNNSSSEEWYGTISARYKDIKNNCLNHIRTIPTSRFPVGTLGGFYFKVGWHFTSMGGYEEVKRKLNDSYTEESYNSAQVRSRLKENMANNKDFLGRGFTYSKDESNWPQYLKDNKEKYKHLLI